MKKTLAALMLALPAVIFQMPASMADAQGTIDPSNGKPCHQCHRSKITGRYVHEAVAGKECTPCHQTRPGNHQSDHSLYAVKDRSATLCYECHDNQSNQKSVHPPIMANECLGCHAPHNSPHRKLLRAKPEKLCFECHDCALVKERETTKTGFRDGTQNLHYLHAGRKGAAIPCLTCHDAHASQQLYLMRPKGAKGAEAVTITYTATDKGGNCTTSCHDSLGYQRD
ncbi:cytochrome c3 family protein [Geobacter sp. SVR]|uniref:cytochrome c3 family protein n=1 Tax=Geobacter sp. SVR TaxID=2495594 RepID=UPI00143EFB36|nr:cytochrome c3 family protein [Geobacter sp. SVR]BCS52584.1 hypothetical protein GSVR_08920 [Geobacter sp. SVR]GCF83978.1 hypothetical protein GSbR_05780 [Geobacter sp. SVR]